MALYSSSVQTHSVNVIPTPTPSYSKSISYSKLNLTHKVNHKVTLHLGCVEHIDILQLHQKFIVPDDIKFYTSNFGCCRRRRRNKTLQDPVDTQYVR